MIVFVRYGYHKDYFIEKKKYDFFSRSNFTLWKEAK
jgi:hypothetical protein